MDMIFYWIQDRTRENHFHIFWEEGNKNLSDYFTKKTIWHHRTMRPRYLNPTKTYIENSKDRQNGTGRGCAGTTNNGLTRKPDNTLKITRNPISW